MNLLSGLTAACELGVQGKLIASQVLMLILINGLLGVNACVFNLLSDLATACELVVQGRLITTQVLMLIPINGLFASMISF